MTTPNKVRHMYLWLFGNIVLSVSKVFSLIRPNIDDSLHEAFISANTALVATPKHSSLEVYGLLH
jgi:hypothetical protein